jgi:hypothetical protein
MAKFTSKASRVFYEKLKGLISPERFGHIWPGAPVHKLLNKEVDNGEWKGLNESIEVPRWGGNFDFAATEKLFNQYGTYLELVDGDEPIGETRVFEFTSPRRGGDRLKSLDTMFEEAHDSMQRFGDFLMESFNLNFMSAPDSGEAL